MALILIKADESHPEGICHKEQTKFHVCPGYRSAHGFIHGHVISHFFPDMSLKTDMAQLSCFSQILFLSIFFSNPEQRKHYLFKRNLNTRKWWSWRISIFIFWNKFSLLQSSEEVILKKPTIIFQVIFILLCNQCCYPRRATVSLTY